MEEFFTGEFALEYDSWNESIPLQIDDVDGLKTSTGFQSPEIFIKVKLWKLSVLVLRGGPLCSWGRGCVFLQKIINNGKHTVCSVTCEKSFS